MKLEIKQLTQIALITVNKQFVSQCLNQLTIAVVVGVVVVILPNWITFSTTQPRICNR